MPRGNVGETVGGMFDDLKSKLGFNQGSERDDGYDDFDDYSDFDEYEEYGESYDGGDSVGGYRSLSPYGSSSSRYDRSNVQSSLVSINDVKASTPMPSRGSREPIEFDESRYIPTRSVIDATAPAPSSPAHTAALRASAQGSQSSGSVVESHPTTTPYDPYEAYSSNLPSKHAPTRNMTVVKPTVYGDVERVARAVKSGDVVVLAMRYTPTDLSKRILDFSFGVASALDANVECPGDKVFAIAKGNALTVEEKRRLGAQGVL